MPEFVALDWERHQLCGLDAQVTKGGRVRVRQAFRLQWPEGIDEQDPQQAGRWLAEELGRLGIRARQALVSLPREDVLVRQLQVPDVPDEELPQVVRMQAETKVSSSLDEVALDFLPLPAMSGEGRPVLMVTLTHQRLDRLQQTAEAAGLELISVGISPTATAELVASVDRQRHNVADETSLIVARHGRRVEISLMRNHHLLFTHSTQVSGEDDEQDSRVALAEIRRSQGALTRLDPQVAVRRAWVIGDERENATLRRTLGERLDCDVQPLDPVTESGVDFTSQVPDEHSPYAGPVGMLLAQAERTVSAIDLLNPRKTVVPPDRRRLWIAVAAAACVLAVAAVYGTVRSKAGALDRQISAKQELLGRLEDSLERGEHKLDDAQTVREWSGRNGDLLEQLRQLKQAIPDSERLYLTDLQFYSGAARSAGRMEGTGNSRSRDAVERLYQALSKRGYTVAPKGISRSSPDNDYPFQFDLELEIQATAESRPISR